MGRPRKYIVDPDQLLAAIQAAYEADLAEIQAENDRDPFGYLSWACYVRFELKKTTELGVSVDLERFAGRALRAGDAMPRSHSRDGATWAFDRLRRAHHATQTHAGGRGTSQKYGGEQCPRRRLTRLASRAASAARSPMFTAPRR